MADLRTPPPWLAPEDVPGAIVAAAEPGMSLLGLDVDGLAIFINQPDAAFVVACVNAHGDLVAALEAALRDSGCDGDLCMHQWHEDARAALAKARDEIGGGR